MNQAKINPSNNISPSKKNEQPKMEKNKKLIKIK